MDILYDIGIGQFYMAVPIGVFAFILSYSFILSKRFATAFMVIEQQEAALQLANVGLEAKVRDRTASLEQSLAEKEVLLREVHHRVKNNLQVIVSLLNLQSDEVADGPALHALAESKGRIKSMMLIHEKLYNSRNLAELDFEDYIENIVSDIFSTYGADQERIGFQIEATVRKLDLDAAVPCGLIINELVTNAHKHAFPSGRIGGLVSVRLSEDGKGEYELTVADNGVGLPAQIDMTAASTLGLRLVSGLATRQLKGTIAITREQGTSVSIRFPDGWRNAIMKKKKIMIVEDETVVADDIESCLIKSGYAVPASVSTGEEAIKILMHVAPSLVLMDIHLAGNLDGIETARRIAEIADIPIIFLTAYSDAGILERVKAVEPFGYIVKPFDRDELRCIIETTLVKHERMKEKVMALEQMQRLLLERVQPGFDPVASAPGSDRRSWPLKIFTLGGFTLVKDGAPFKFKGKVQQKPLTLLKALIAFGGKDVAQQLLIDAIWPDADGDLAHRSFEMAVHRLRKLIGTEGIIQLQERRLTLTNSSCWVDTWAFEELCEKVGVAWKNGGESGEGSSEAVRLSDRAIGLYQGHFLSMDTDDAWVISYRERLRNKFLRLISLFGAHLQQENSWESAIDIYQKGLEIDGRVEEFYQQLMICYQQLGRRAEAAEAFSRCSEILRSSFGIGPSSKTVAMYQALKKQE